MALSDFDWDRLERYVSGRGAPEELAELDRWVQSSPELRALAGAMFTVGQVPGGPAQSWDEEAAWRRVARRMRWFGRPLRPGAPDLRRSRWFAWAAAAVIVAAGSWLVLLEFPSRTQRNRVVAVAPAREVVTRRGERAGFSLADGTRVMLGADSRLTIPPSYDQPGAGRQVRLEGQGYFLVTHDSLRPFLVHTRLGTAEDLGTEFVVSTYAEAGGMRVVVATGKVALRQRPAAPAAAAPGDSLPLVTLGQGDLARLDSAGTATVTRVDPAAYLAWTRGALVFDGTPLREVLPQLARWYDLDIRLADDSLGARRLTATFRDQSISAVLDQMALSLELRVKRAGRTVVLHPSSSSRRS
jgi:ferric-dicitrate binding protein FerR (iron transport regulator)